MEEKIIAMEVNSRCVRNGQYTKNGIIGIYEYDHPTLGDIVVEGFDRVVPGFGLWFYPKIVHKKEDVCLWKIYDNTR